MKLVIVLVLFGLATLGGTYAKEKDVDSMILRLLTEMLAEKRTSQPGVAGKVPEGLVGPVGPPGPEGKICSKVVDLVLILDDSGSLEHDEWKSLIDFAKDIVNLFEVSDEGAHVSVITFSDTSMIRFQLNEKQSNADVTAALDALPHVGGGTNTFLALDQARTGVYGADNVRSDVPKLAIVLTDGESSDEAKTAEAARLLRDEDVKVFAIGIGNAQEIKEAELDAMASEPTAEFSYRVDNFDALEKIAATILERACKSIPDIGGFHGGCTIDAAQVVFVMDESGSVHWRDFDLVKDFTQRVVEKVGAVGEGDSTFGAITYNEAATVEFSLADQLDKDQTMEKLKAMKHDGGGTQTWLGLDEMREMFAATAGPEGASKIGIVVSDGHSEDLQKTADAAKAARDAGITLFAVAVKGDEGLGEEELKAIASEDDYVIAVDNYDELAGIVGDLTQMTCWAVLKKK